MIRVLNAGEVSLSEILARTEDKRDIAGTVSAILADVRQNGDAALRRYTKEFDGAEPDALEVPASLLDQALAGLDRDLRAVLEEAAENIRAFHRRQIRSDFIISEKNGVILGQKITPINRAALYIPGGTAAYPSTVLMNCIPAKLAGCREIVMVSPPTCGGDINPVILAAARLAGVDRVFRCGGAQAVAALAYGTETVPQADKIVGPGNAFVAEAKRQVYGQVGIDVIAGPSEILVVADAQAVRTGLERQLALLPRGEIARASIEANGKIILTGTVPEAIEIANALAPEHLELCVDNPFDYLDQVKNAGSIFMGRHCPEALGDYFAGPNHTLPTNGAARYASPLSVDDFIKKSQFTYYTGPALSAAAGKIAAFARQEGLEGHARSVQSRFEEETEA